MYDTGTEDAHLSDAYSKLPQVCAQELVTRSLPVAS